MAYPPPPGTNSLPPRPPASSSSSTGNSNNGHYNTGSSGRGRGGFKPAFPSTSYSPAQPYGANYGAAPASQYGQSSYPSYPGSAGVNSSGGRGYSSYQAQPQSYGPQSYGSASYSAAPQIRNPFPTPGQAGSAAAGAGGAGGEYDVDMAAQIAQWQSAYTRDPSKEVDKDGKPLSTDSPKPEQPPQFQQQQAAGAYNGNPDKKKTVVREGGGKKWTDDSLLEWDPAHLRLFVGNLAGETTDDSLLKAFSKWKSVQKARVIRDKRTNKSKQYGFVSFSNADDFFDAAKSMNNQYIQSHPVIVRKANTEIKATNVKDKRDRRNNNNNKKRSGNQQGSNSAGHEANLGPHGGGITKPGQKTKNGLRLLG